MSAYVLESERLGLRPWTLADGAAFHAIWGDPEVIWWGDTTRDAEDAATRLERILSRFDASTPGLGWWAAVERESGDVVGNVFLQPAKLTPGLELGYHFLHRVWNRGLATEAARAAVAYARDVLGVDQLSAPVHVDNHRSQRVIEKAGFHVERDVEHAGLPHRLYVHPLD